MLPHLRFRLLWIILADTTAVEQNEFGYSLGGVKGRLYDDAASHTVPNQYGW